MFTPYHPQTNGVVERINRTICNMLKKYVNDKHDKWDRYLNSVLFANRTSKHETTKYTPFFLMFNKQDITPAELIHSSVNVLLDNNSNNYSSLEYNIMEENLDQKILKQTSSIKRKYRVKN